MNSVAKEAMEATQDVLQLEALLPSTDQTLTSASNNLAPTSASVSTDPSSSSTPEEEPPGKKIRREHCPGSTKSDVMACDKNLVSMIIKRFQCLSILEDINFIQFCNTLNPSYTLPSQEVVSNELIPKLYNEEKANFFTQLEHISHLSITTVIWNTTTENFWITVMCHYIHENKMLNMILETSVLAKSCTDHDIFKILHAIFVKWKIEKKIVAIVSDNKIKTAVTRHLHIEHLSCVGHALSLCINIATRNTPTLDQILEKCQKLFTYLKDSFAIIDKRKGSVLNNDLKASMHKLAYMRSLLNSKSYIICLSLPNTLALEDSDWDVIRDYVELISTMLTLILLFKDKYPAYSLVIPFVSGLTNDLTNQSPQTATGKRLKSALVSTVSQQFNYLEKNIIISKCTFLDPRFKSALFSSKENARKAQQLIEDELTELLTEQEGLNHSNIQSSEEPNLTLPWKYINSKIMEIQSEKNNARNRAESIVRKFLDLPYLGKLSDPLDTWNTYKSDFPELFKLHLKYAAIPAISTLSKMSLLEVPCPLPQNILNYFTFLKNHI